MLFNTGRTYFLDEVMLLITTLFPENVSSLVSRNALEQCAATTVLETRSAEERNLYYREGALGYEDALEAIASYYNNLDN